MLLLDRHTRTHKHLNTVTTVTGCVTKCVMMQTPSLPYISSSHRLPPSVTATTPALFPQWLEPCSGEVQGRARATAIPVTSTTMEGRDRPRVLFLRVDPLTVFTVFCRRPTGRQRMVKQRSIPSISRGPFLVCHVWCVAFAVLLVAAVTASPHSLRARVTQSGASISWHNRACVCVFRCFPL